MLALLLSLACIADTPSVFRIPVTASESLAVTISGEGVTLVVIPGLTGSAFAFRRLTPLLVAAGHRVVIVEPLGMGTSGRPERADYTLEAQARRVASVLDTLRVEGALVLGHALSGSIALRLALARPDLVRGVVLVAEQAATRGFRRAMLFAPWVKMMGGQGLVRKQLRKSLAQSSADPGWITDEVIEGYSSGWARNLDQTLKGYLKMADAHDRNRLAPRLGQLRIPVLLILGAAAHEGGPDSKEVELLSKGVASISVQLVAAAGHNIQEERPAELAVLITAFDVPRP